MTAQDPDTSLRLVAMTDQIFPVLRLALLPKLTRMRICAAHVSFNPDAKAYRSHRSDYPSMPSLVSKIMETRDEAYGRAVVKCELRMGSCRQPGYHTSAHSDEMRPSHVLSRLP